MCLYPKKILNPSLSWHVGMPKYIIVSCNECSECRARKQQEWFIRACEEFKNCRHGSNFFVTLTFRNEDLPFYQDKRDFEYSSKTFVIDANENNHIISQAIKIKKPVLYRFPCFDGDMITDFQKKFRVYLSRKYPNQDTSGVKFLICPEFGKQTRRQHYHVQIDSPFFIPVRDFKEICRKAWTHGWIGASKNKGFLMRSEAACQYTAKYVNKDQYYFSEAMQKYLDKDSLDEFEYKYRYEKVKRYLPRVRVSMRFGASLAKKIEARKDVVDYCTASAPIEKFNKSGKTSRYQIPRYIMSLLTRRIDKYASNLVCKPVYTYTELGRKIRKEMFLKRLEADILRCRVFKDSQYILHTLNDYGLISKHISERLPELLRDIDLKDFCFYRKFLRFLPVVAYGKHTAFWYNRRFEQLVYDFTESKYIPSEVYDAFMSSDDFVPPKESMLFDFYGCGHPLENCLDIHRETLSDLGEFRLYEEATKLLEQYYALHSRQRSRIIDERNDRVERTRSQCVEYVEYSSIVTRHSVA